MSDFGVFPYEVTSVYHHPNADRLDMVILNNGIRTIALRGRFPVGENLGTRVWFIPENSLLPENLLRFLGMWDDQKGKGKLSGSNGNRVKPMRLRGEMSDGILLSEDDISELCRGSVWSHDDTDIAEILGITKWEPVIPQNMSGRSGNAGTEFTLNFDLNSIYKARQSDMFNPGESVIVTEKLHGTACRIAFVYEDYASDFIKENTIYVPEYSCYVYAFSKGLGNKGIIFTKDDETSIYQKMAVKFAENAHNVPGLNFLLDGLILSVTYLGEICGPGIQDMTYGLKEPTFFCYAIETKTGFDKTIYMNFFRNYEDGSLLKFVPLLAEGRWNHPVAKNPTLDINTLRQIAESDSVFGGIREGIVVSSLDTPNRKFKLVSDRYLTRTGTTTDYN